MSLIVLFSIEVKFHVDIARIYSIKFELSQSFREWITDVIASNDIDF